MKYIEITILLLVMALMANIITETLFTSVTPPWVTPLLLIVIILIQLTGIILGYRKLKPMLEQ